MSGSDVAYYIFILFCTASGQYIITYEFNQDLNCTGVPTKIDIQVPQSNCQSVNCYAQGTTLSLYTTCGAYPNISSDYYFENQGYSNPQCTGLPTIGQYFLVGYCFPLYPSGSQMFSCTQSETINYSDNNCTMISSYNYGYACTNTAPYATSGCQVPSEPTADTTGVISSYETTQNVNTQGVVGSSEQSLTNTTMDKMVYTLGSVSLGTRRLYCVYMLLYYQMLINI